MSPKMSTGPRPRRVRGRAAENVDGMFGSASAPRRRVRGRAAESVDGMFGSAPRPRPRPRTIRSSVPLEGILTVRFPARAPGPLADDARLLGDLVRVEAVELQKRVERHDVRGPQRAFAREEAVLACGRKSGPNPGRGPPGSPRHGRDVRGQSGRRRDTSSDEPRGSRGVAATRPRTSHVVVAAPPRHVLGRSGVAATCPRTIHVAPHGVATTRPREIHAAAAAAPRSRAIHAAAAAPPRRVHGRSTWRPRRGHETSSNDSRRGRGVPRHVQEQSTRQPRHGRDTSSNDSRGKPRRRRDTSSDDPPLGEVDLDVARSSDGLARTTHATRGAQKGLVLASARILAVVLDRLGVELVAVEVEADLRDVRGLHGVRGPARRPFDARDAPREFPAGKQLFAFWSRRGGGRAPRRRGARPVPVRRGARARRATTASSPTTSAALLMTPSSASPSWRSSRTTCRRRPAAATPGARRRRAACSAAAIPARRAGGRDRSSASRRGPKSAGGRGPRATASSTRAPRRSTRRSLRPTQACCFFGRAPRLGRRLFKKTPPGRRSRALARRVRSCGRGLFSVSPTRFLPCVGEARSRTAWGRR